MTRGEVILGGYVVIRCMTPDPDKHGSLKKQLVRREEIPADLYFVPQTDPDKIIVTRDNGREIHF